jgi:hypothetical protein
MVRAMTYRLLIASLGAVVLLLVANETFAASGVHGAGMASRHPNFRPPVARSQQHRRNHVGGYWSGVGDYYGPTTDEPIADGTQPGSGDRHYTYTYDVPWDAVHRFPPAVTPSGRPYVSECPTQVLTVPGRDGTERTVNIVRCY